MEADTRRAFEDFTRELTRLSRRLDSQEKGRRSNQLAHSSLEEGQTIEARDETGTLRGRWGWVDGAVGLVTEGGEPVSAPTAPTVTPSLGGLRVTWDGLLAGDPAIPVDFDHMAVHISTASGFTPSAATYVGSIRRAGEGGMLPVVPLPYVEHYVRLVPVTTGGVQGAPSVEVSATPLQTSGVDLEADSVEAVHIKAGAVEADKLEAVLALVTTIIAGIPGAARVEMDQDGLRGYNASNELIFAIDSSGNAVFSGDIVASEISGSRFSLTSSSGATGVIEDTSGVVRTQVVSPSGARAQLASTAGQAEFSVWGDAGTSTTPAGGMLATPGSCQVNLLSNVTDTVTSPLLTLVALPTEARVQARGGTGSDLRITAQDAWAGVSATPEPSTVGQPPASPGTIYAFRRSGTDAPTLSLQSPVSTSGAGADRRSIIHVEGANDARTYTVLNHAARVHYLQGELVSGSTDTTTDGSVQLADTHSILAPRHRPQVQPMAIAPVMTTSQTTGSFVDFTATQWPRITFKTGWSGWVEISILMAGQNPNSDASSIAVGFRLTGAGTLAADLARCAFVRSLGTGINATASDYASYPLQLAGNSTYTLIPAWRLSSWNTDRPPLWDGSLANQITVRNLT
ncbi:hypothetical protein [Nocardiopsis tropica]|uniref:Uncharacterized protein n=1 Tax=Nocardiopsis tropica TaxID=109330 RepID=A0ABU7KQY1_9ACTN|nr:hypothetical protein [Nocardiopsis umidischolae]MEE2051708.1 hypothetical protein [Nocardiopsis umidischolae]